MKKQYLLLAAATIDGKIAKLSEELRNGDVTQILVAKEPRATRDWLRMARTSMAKGKIRSYLNKHQRGWFAGFLPKIPFIKKG